jgi:hypothetical protein
LLAYLCNAARARPALATFPIARLERRRHSLPAIAAGFSHLLKHVVSNRSSLGSQKDLGATGIARVCLDCYETKARFAIPCPVADVPEVSRHGEATTSNGAGVGADAFALIKNDHQECRDKGKRN